MEGTKGLEAVCLGEMEQNCDPQKWGGCGLKHLLDFTQELATKKGWLLLNHKSLWLEVVSHKYIWPNSIIEWTR